MSADPLAGLTAALGERPPASFADLPAETLDLLEGAVHDARRAQLAALAQSLDGALRLAPFPIRGLIRKMVT